MLICVPGVLAKDDGGGVPPRHAESEWEDGRSTAGFQSKLVKQNTQLPPAGPLARRLGEHVIKALTASPLFMSAAIPKQIFPPLFQPLRVNDCFGTHVDNAVRGDHHTGIRIRTDLSVTLFLSEPDEYDGGELVVEDLYGSHEVKLPAGDLVLYPATSLHMVTPITPRCPHRIVLLAAEHGAGRAHARSLIFDLDNTIQSPVRARWNERCGCRQVDGHLSQPHSLLGRGLVLPRRLNTTLLLLSLTAAGFLGTGAFAQGADPTPIQLAPAGHELSPWSMFLAADILV